MPGYPVTPILFVASAAAIVLNTIVSQPGRAAVGIGVLLLGSPAYLIWRRRGAPAGAKCAGTAGAPIMTGEGIVIRRVETQAEYEECVRIEDETWGAGFSERVPSAILRVAQYLGGVTAAAFEAGTTRGSWDSSSG